jgi:microcystin-dependent protein
MVGATTPPPEPTQPTPFAIPSYIAMTGEYPAPDGIAVTFLIAMIHSAVGAQGQPNFNVLPADGRQLSAENGANAPLYSIILNQFGGDVPNFALPDLRGRAVIGTTPVAPSPAHVVQMMWLMATQSEPPFEGLAGIAAGMVIPFAGTTVPYGWVSCDGSLFTEGQYPQLYALFGNAFGWLPGGQVALPRLADTMVVGAGAPYAPG